MVVMHDLVNDLWYVCGIWNNIFGYGIGIIKDNIYLVIDMNVLVMVWNV